MPKDNVWPLTTQGNSHKFSLLGARKAISRKGHVVIIVSFPLCLQKCPVIEK